MRDAVTVLALHIGKARERWPGRPPSAIGKQAVQRPLALLREGFAEDEQADRQVHGGPEKAVHHYPCDHYAHWRETFPDHASVFAIGGFGENIATEGITEETVCLGDRFRLGSALVEICQGRQPCWKLSSHTGIPEMAARLQKSGRTGWYYRVLEEGMVAPGDMLTPVERPLPDWPLSRIIKARFDPRIAPGEAACIADLAPLSQSWRDSFVKRADPSYREDTRARLQGV
jgi:MOSC domain-containing protein YiiM